MSKSRRRREPSLRAKLQVENTSALIDLLVDVGFREDKPWPENDPESEAILGIVNKISKKLTNRQLKAFQECQNAKK